MATESPTPVRAPQRGAREFLVRHREKVRYLVVGAWNTLFAYSCFSVLYFLLHDSLAPSAILLIASAIASVNGYLAFRRFVFAPMRHPVLEYLRFQVVYLPILLLNLVLLPLALTYSNLNAYVIQAGFAVFAIVAAYLGNKYFTFRRPGTGG
jgi:putative flippase GtrA